MTYQFVVEVREPVDQEPDYVYVVDRFLTIEQAVELAREYETKVKTTYGRKPEVNIYVDNWL
jgi:hypothetical protein